MAKMSKHASSPAKTFAGKVGGGAGSASGAKSSKGNVANAPAMTFSGKTKK